MRKFLTVLFSLFFLFSITFGVETDAVRNVSKLRMIQRLAASRPEIPESKAIPENRVTGFRNRETMRLGVDRLKQAIRQPESFQLDWSGTLRADERLMNTKNMVLDSLVLMYGLTDSVSYVAGQPLFLFVPAPDTVWLDIYVDNGDGVLCPGDFYVNDLANGIYLVDGQEPDMTPVDGVVAFVLNTTMLDEVGAFFGLQGFRLFIVAHTSAYPLPANGVIDILAPDENTSISGKIQVATPVVPVPAANVVVWAVFLPDSVYSKEYQMIGFVTMTDITGAYTIQIPDIYRGQFVVGTQDIWNLYPGTFPSDMVQLNVQGDVTDVNFVYTLATDHILGTVTDDLGQPVAGMTLYASNDFSNLQAVTDQAGQYNFLVSPGYWRLNFNPEELSGRYMNFNERYFEVISGIAHQEDFILYTTDGTIEGDVVDASRTPLANVEIWANIGSRPDSTGYQEYYFGWTQTDASGHYILKVSKALQHPEISQYNATYNVGCWTETGISIPSNYWGIFADTTGLNFMILNTNAKLSGKIFDANSYVPLRDANIHVMGNIPGLTYPIDQWYWTNDDGFYEFDLIGGSGPGGIKYAVEVYYPYQWRPSLRDSLVVTAGDNLIRDYYIEPPLQKGRIEGHVYRYDWTGIEGARVEFSGPNYYERYTGPGGHYALDNVDFGLYTGTASVSGFPPVTITDILVGDYPTWIDFWMGADTNRFQVSGIVKDATTNKPLGGALVFANRPDRDDGPWFLTDTTGYYEFKLEPGLYEIGAGGNGYYVQVIDSLWVDQDKTIDFSLNPAPIVGNLSGTIVDVNYNPLSGTIVYMESQTEQYFAFAITDMNGQYSVPLIASEYNAHFAKEGFRNEFRNFIFPGGNIDNPLVMYPFDYTSGPKLIEVNDVPMDQGKQVRLTWKKEEGMYFSVKEYQIWRAIEPLPGPEPGMNQKLSWDFVATVPVHADWDIYNYVAPTLYDKVQENTHWTGFMVTAIGWDGWTYWDSNVKGGWSEDNLPPGIPKNLKGTVTTEGIALTWDEVTDEPVKFYTVYRKADGAEFALLGHSEKPEFVDAMIATGKSYDYTVTATDYGLNESNVAETINMVSLSVSGVREIPKSFALSQNYPNPFNPRTSMEVALPKSSDVYLTIYNLMGQIVKEYSSRNLPAGYHRYVWDGRDASGNLVSGGVYIYSLKAGDFRQTKKMILLK